MGGCLGLSSSSFPTWRGEGHMLPPEKRESQKDKEKRGGVHLCTVGHEKLLSWILVLTLSLRELLQGEFAPEEQIDSK